METNLTLVSLLVAQLLIAGWLMWRSPYNPLSIVGMLTTTFSYLPAFLLVNGSGFVSYSWRTFTSMDVASAVDAAVFLGVLNLCLLIGGAAAQQFHGKKSFLGTGAGATLPRTVSLYGSDKLSLVAGAYFMLWLAAAMALYLQSGQTLTEFLLPIQKTGIAAEQSGYLRSIYLAIPSALIVMSYWKHGRFRVTGWIWVILALAATFSTHQRRELITTALLVLSLPIFLGPLRESFDLKGFKRETDPIKLVRRMRLTVFAALLAGLLLVPLLWYARVFFTTWDEGSDVNVFEIRSFSDILFGSPTTGFPTFVYIRDFVADYGTDTLYLLAYPLTIFFPRALWESKPRDLDTILQSQYGLLENPSSFWYGEMYYDFGFFAPIATLVLAFLFFRFCAKSQSAPSLWYRTIAALVFMQCVTLFKNGVTVFIIRTLVLVVFLGIAWMVCRPQESEAGSDVVTDQPSVPV